VCIDLYQTGFLGKGSDHLQLIKFWPSCTSGKWVCGGAKNFDSAYYSQRGVFASMQGHGGANFFDPPYHSQRAMSASLSAFLILFFFHELVEHV